MLNTRHLETLCRIAATGSFSQTSTELNIPLSTLSMQMKALEAQLDAQLFDRSQRPPALTPLGRRVAEKANEIIAAEARLIAVTSGDTAITGTWRLGMVATASVRLLPSFLKTAGQKVPEAGFQIETGLSEVLETRILSGQIDAAVVSASNAPQKGISYLGLREEPLVFALPQTDATQSNDETDLNTLLEGSPFLQFNPGSGIGKQIELYMQKHFTDPARIIVLDSIEAIMECVNEGLGFTLLSEADARRYGNDNLRFVYPQADNPKRTLALAWAERSISSEKMIRLAALFV